MNQHKLFLETIKIIDAHKDRRENWHLRRRAMRRETRIGTDDNNYGEPPLLSAQSPIQIQSKFSKTQKRLDLFKTPQFYSIFVIVAATAIFGLCVYIYRSWRVTVNQRGSATCIFPSRRPLIYSCIFTRAFSGSGPAGY